MTKNSQTHILHTGCPAKLRPQPASHQLLSSPPAPIHLPLLRGKILSASSQAHSLSSKSASPSQLPMAGEWYHLPTPQPGAHSLLLFAFPHPNISLMSSLVDFTTTISLRPSPSSSFHSHRLIISHIEHCKNLLIGLSLPLNFHQLNHITTTSCPHKT